MSNLGRIQELFRQLQAEVELLSAENAELRQTIAAFEQQQRSPYDSPPEQAVPDDEGVALEISSLGLVEKSTPDAPKGGGKLKAVKNFFVKRLEHRRPEPDQPVSPAKKTGGSRGATDPPELWSGPVQRKGLLKKLDRWTYLRSFDAHREGVWEVVVSPSDPTRIASASFDGTARVWAIDGR